MDHAAGIIDGFSSVMLEFEKWTVDLVHEWISALPIGSLSESGRCAVLSCHSISGADLACCSNNTSFLSENNPACGIKFSLDSGVGILGTIPGLTGNDIHFLCDELDALRELRVLMKHRENYSDDDDDAKHDNISHHTAQSLEAAEMNAAAIQRVLQQQWDESIAKSAAAGGVPPAAAETRGATWTPDWEVPDAPPIAFAPASCLHMNSDAEDSEAQDTDDDRECDLPHAIVKPSSCARHDHDEFDALLDEAVESYRQRFLSQ